MKKFLLTLLFILIPISLFSNNIKWKLVNSNTNINLTGLHFINENLGVAIGFSGTILKTTDEGETWNKVDFNSHTAFATIFFIDSLRGWIGGTKSSYSPSEVLYYTDDAGLTWIAKSVASITSVMGIYFFDKDNGLITDKNGNIYSTTDNGSHWKLLYQTNFLTNGLKYFNNLVWVYGYFGNILISSDKGLTWSKLNNFPPNVNAYNITRTESGDIWVCGNGGAIYSTSNNGLAWQKRNSNTSDYLWTIDFFDNNNGLFGGGWTSGVVGYTSDGGVSWELQELPTNNFIADLKIISQNRIVAVGQSGTILIGEKQKTDVNEKENASYNKIFIYPNPITNNNINLKINLEIPATIKIDLINSLGIKVGKTLSNYLNAGSHTIRYTPNANLPSGTYWLRMTINNKENIVKPVVIIK